MIKQFNNFIQTMIKPDYDLILENLMSDFQKDIFDLFYVQKLEKKDIENKLKISRYKLDKNLENIRAKILKIPQFDFKFKCNDTTEEKLRARCKKLGKSQDYEDFCVYAFIKRLKNEQIADIMCIDVETVRKYKIKRKKELEQ